MKKKKFITPKVRVIRLDAQELLAGSDGSTTMHMHDGSVIDMSGNGSNNGSSDEPGEGGGNTGTQNIWGVTN